MFASAASDGPLIRQQLARLVENPRFAGAPKMRAFLQFIVERTLSGEADEIKEYTVALAVYGRRPDYDPKTDSIVRVEAGRLRSRLKEYYENEGKSDPVVIELPKGSYIPSFRVVPVQETPEPPPAFEPVAADLSVAGVTPSQPRWSLRVIAAALALTGIVVLAGIFLWRSHRVETQPSISIVPFANLSLDPGNDALTRELSKNVEVELTRSGKLRVIGTGKADLALEASVRRRDNRIRVIAQLLDRRDGAYIWSDSFERESSDNLPLSDTARRIATDVESQAVLANRLRSADSNPRGKALELFRHGKAQLRLKDDGFLLRGSESYEKPSLEAVSRAIALLEQAVTVDPTFAAGHGTLATYYQMAGDIDVRMLEKAVRSARRAIEIDPNLGEAHATLGYIDYMYYWKFKQAAEEFRIALEHEPRMVTTHRLYSDCLALLGRMDEADRALERARVLFPGNSVIETKRVLALYYEGDFVDMEREARNLVAQMPNFPLAHWVLGLAAEQVGRLPEAIQEFETCLKISPGDGRCIPALGHAYAVAGRTDEAERILESIRNRPATQTRAPYEMALIQNGLKKEDVAVANLQSAFDQRELGFPYLKTEPRFANLRRRSEIKTLLAKIGL